MHVLGFDGLHWHSTAHQFTAQLGKAQEIHMDSTL
jgi:hypothetical protein